jgi:hypothetical protein
MKMLAGRLSMEIKISRASFNSISLRAPASKLG